MGNMKKNSGNMKKYAEICGECEGICGNYEVGFTLDKCPLIQKNSELSPHIGSGTYKNFELHPL